jgi:membrane-bound serine protease (ClpP class)
MEQTVIASFGGSSLGLVVVLVVVGLLALGVELFILPGFGVVGVLGVAALIGSVAVAWVQYGPFWGGVTVAGSTTLAIVMTTVMLKSRRVRSRFVLDAHLESGGGTQSRDLSGLVGRVGTAKSNLRPAGIAEIDGARVDVVSQGRFIEKGASVKVVEIDGPRVVVVQTD